MKNLIKSISFVVLLAALFAMLGFANKKHRDTRCKSLEIGIYTNGADQLVQKKEVSSIVASVADSVINKTVAEIDAEMIEKELKKNPYIKEANVYSDLAGNLQIDVYQRMPLLRIIDEYNHKYYIDHEGNIFRNSTGKAVRVLIANGNLDNIKLPENIAIMPLDSLKDQRIKDVFFLAQMISNDHFLQSQIDQIYVNGNNEYELIPKVGRHYIEFGGADLAEDKLFRLKTFYTKGLRNKDWTQYNKVSLKYQNQVVCTKK